MVALTGGRGTPLRLNDDIESHPIKAGVTIFPGALVALDAAGWAQPGAVALGLKSVGRAEEGFGPVVANGAAQIRTRRGVLRYANSAAADQVTRADIGASAFIVDDQTVAKTNGGGTRSPAGIIRDVDAQGVWVLI